MKSWNIGTSPLSPLVFLGNLLVPKLFQFYLVWNKVLFIRNIFQNIRYATFQDRAKCVECFCRDCFSIPQPLKCIRQYTVLIN